MQTITVDTELVANFRDTMRATADTARLTGPRLTFVVADDASDLAIAEKAWTVGNRMARDDEGFAWPSNVRSMSTGDVVHLRTDGDFRTLRSLVAVMVGFEAIDTLEVIRHSTADTTEYTDGMTNPENELAYVLHVEQGLDKDDAIAEAKRRLAR